MSDDVIGITVTLAALAVILPLALTHGMFRAREIQDAWRRLAERHRLHYELAGVAAVRISGSVRGRELQMWLAGAKNKKKKRQGAFMELELNGALPAGLKMRSIGKHTAEHVEVLGEPTSEQDEKTGAISINDEAEVSALDADELRTYLTAQRKRAALRLADVGGELDGSTLRVPVVEHVADLEELDRILHTLDEVAVALDVRVVARSPGQAYGAGGMHPRDMASTPPEFA